MSAKILFISKEVYIKKMKLFILTIVLSATALAKNSVNDGLTPIERDPCLLFSAIPKAQNARPFLDFVAAFEEDCDDDWHPPLCYSLMRVRQTYTYHEVTYTDYYNSAGKVVVTKAKKDGSTFEASVSMSL